MFQPGKLGKYGTNPLWGRVFEAQAFNKATVLGCKKVLRGVGAEETPNDKLPAVFYGEGAKPRPKQGTGSPVPKTVYESLVFGLSLCL